MLRARPGFTLLEVLVALAILAFALTIITGSASSSAIHSKRVYRSTVAALLLRGTLLDIEEKYRKDGFPSNDLTDRDCELPKQFERQFKCRFDLLGLSLDAATINDMTQQSQQVLAKAQETLASSGALDKLQSLSDGKKPAAQDMAAAMAKAANTNLDLTTLAKGGDLMSLLQTIILTGDQAGVALLDLCDINLAVLQMSMGLMVAELLPRILKRASERTRKVVIKLSWKDDEGEAKTLELETFTTAVSEEEAKLLHTMKQVDKLQSAIESKLPPPRGGR
ncbi:MAG: type II secretion system protein [Myxococcales bacterium]|nr:type II secretion system protein [Myxococcales bacterium]